MIFDNQKEEERQEKILDAMVELGDIGDSKDILILTEAYNQFIQATVILRNNIDAFGELEDVVEEVVEPGTPPEED